MPKVEKKFPDTYCVGKALAASEPRRTVMLSLPDCIAASC